MKYLMLFQNIKKIAKKIAFECFDMYKGNWKLSSPVGSESVYIFLEKVTDEYTSYNNKYSDRILYV